MDRIDFTAMAVLMVLCASWGLQQVAISRKGWNAVVGNCGRPSLHRRVHIGLLGTRIYQRIASCIIPLSDANFRCYRRRCAPEWADFGYALADPLFSGYGYLPGQPACSGPRVWCIREGKSHHPFFSVKSAFWSNFRFRICCIALLYHLLFMDGLFTRPLEPLNPKPSILAEESWMLQPLNLSYETSLCK